MFYYFTGKKSSRSKLSSESGSEPDFVLKTRKRDNIKDDNYHNECDDTNSQNSIESLKVNKKKRISLQRTQVVRIIGVISERASRN
ncbi:hypothetical protein ACS0TY_028659 [Phlomoides rotata]